MHISTHVHSHKCVCVHTHVHSHEHACVHTHKQKNEINALKINKYCEGSRPAYSIEQVPKQRDRDGGGLVIFAGPRIPGKEPLGMAGLGGIIELVGELR